ncbi:tail Collar domain-containing protein [Dyadobacter endophyticus]|uniref:Tail Collar domain-containing protein n=1 Tax=Dyadobacter endophyticus TaxID=1749036 RepID=A0ABQ1YLT8_9BACT|nr:tail fiber protein [Dyadobacter endophyticus]GGH29310.1 tail Collar domain-containing protein [Dyadobacter endophyticus]
MAEPFLSEIRMVSFNFAPKGWALANGQLLPINQNQALFALLGTTYGGNGQTNFALPDFRGRVPIHFGNGHDLGEKAGQEAHTITMQETPQHNHVVNAIDSGPSNLNDPTGAYLANTLPNNFYSTVPGALGALNPATLSNVGGSQAHNNLQPFLVISFCIALQGIFPSRN